MAQSTLSFCSRTLPTCTVSIVGSAGRRGDGKKMNKSLFSKMVKKAKDVITRDFGLELSKVHLVSGGAAWADHVAVVLFVHGEVSQLTLHLPVKWENSKYYESGDNPGHSANTLHHKFSTEMRENTLEHIDCAFMLGAKHSVHNGFLKRNTEVAKSQYLIAFTWGEGCKPKKGGTFDTWSKCEGRKVHIPLGSFNTEQYNFSQSLLDFDSECDGVQACKKYSVKKASHSLGQSLSSSSKTIKVEKQTCCRKRPFPSDCTKSNGGQEVKRFCCRAPVKRK